MRLASKTGGSQSNALEADALTAAIKSHTGLKRWGSIVSQWSGSKLLISSTWGHEVRRSPCTGLVRAHVKHIPGLRQDRHESTTVIALCRSGDA